MELIRGIHNLKPHHSDCVLTIGNFDGVHLGHQAVIGQLSEKAAELHKPSLIMLFEPQPQEYFAKGVFPARLTRFREKIQILHRFAVDRVLCVKFDPGFASMSAEDFIQSLLVKKLGVRYLVIGDDFKFGKGRTGDFQMLQEAGEKRGFQVANMHSFMLDKKRVSSTRIRDLLAKGDMQTAEKLLGRAYRMSGRVAHGDKLGRKIGFPTINIYLHRKTAPVLGIFVVELFGLPGEPITGVANVGTRPTINGTHCLLEVYLFDFNQEVYGHYVHVNFLKKLRNEERFESLVDMQEQIKLDVQHAKAYFKARS